VLSRLVYGGSFDPVHRGHIAMMKYVLARGLTRRLDVVPAKVSPFKQDAPPSLPDEVRLELLEIAVAVACRDLDRPEAIRVLDYELRSPPPSYTAHTLRWLREHHPGESIGILIGSDSFHDLDAWFQPEEIMAHHPVVVFRRTGDEIPDLERRARELSEKFPELSCDFRLLDNPLVDCSSSEIRAALAEGGVGSAGDCLPSEVRGVLAAKN
jgi:nicotinate-nucleotide adenylyltransferase